MSEFPYLYRGGENGRSSERIRQMMQKWMARLKELVRRANQGPRPTPRTRRKIIKGKQKTVTDGPFVEAKDVVGGYIH
jgi:hypothetical protein